MPHLVTCVPQLSCHNVLYTLTTTSQKLKHLHISYKEHSACGAFCLSQCYAIAGEVPSNPACTIPPFKHTHSHTYTHTTLTHTHTPTPHSLTPTPHSFTHTHPHHTHSHTHICTDTLHAHPTYGSVLGGDIIAIQGCLSGQTITCEFDGVQTSVQATPIRDFEVVCVTPPLLRVGQVVLRVMVDGVSAGEISFTSGELYRHFTLSPRGPELWLNSLIGSNLSLRSDH